MPEANTAVPRRQYRLRAYTTTRRERAGKSANHARISCSTPVTKLSGSDLFVWEPLHTHSDPDWHSLEFLPFYYLLILLFLLSGSTSCLGSSRVQPFGVIPHFPAINPDTNAGRDRGLQRNLREAYNFAPGFAATAKCGESGRSPFDSRILFWKALLCGGLARGRAEQLGENKRR